MVYTIFPDFLKNMSKEEGTYITDVLFVFPQKGNAYKVTKDKDGEVISIYKAIKQNADIIKAWLELMSYMPSPFEKIDVDIKGIDCEETKFLTICKNTNGNKNIIVYSRQNLKKYNYSNQHIIFEEQLINVFDRDEAHIKFSKTIKSGDQTYIGSQIAQDNSTISGSQNK